MLVGWDTLDAPTYRANPYLFVNVDVMRAAIATWPLQLANVINSN